MADPKAQAQASGQMAESVDRSTQLAADRTLYAAERTQSKLALVAMVSIWMR